MNIIATADVHSPRFLPLYLRALAEIVEKPDLVLLAGDIIDRGRWRECTRVIAPLKEKWPSTPIVAVYGNEEYDEVKERLAVLCKDAYWLDDEHLSLEIRGLKVGVVGTRGVLDKPTPWQARHIPGIRDVYNLRLTAVEKLLSRSKHVDDVTILLTHYPPRCRTLTGEDERFWETMSSKKLGEVVEKTLPDLVVHGHLHKSIVHQDSLKGVPVYNVALPALKKVKNISLEQRSPGLLGFLGGGR